MTRFNARITRRTFALGAAAASAGIATGIPAGRAVLAQEASPVAAPALPPLPEGATVVADGLFSPRFLALGEDATLYITDAGAGGDEVLSFGGPATGGTPGATPVAQEPAIDPNAPTRGNTGQVVSVTSDGTQSVVASGLPSYTLGPGAAVGAAGIVLGAGEVLFAVGGAAVGNFGIDEVPGENAIHRLTLADGTVSEVAALGPYEIENNPDGTDVNPNLYEMTTGADGRLLVNDAGGNTTFAVDAATGQFELIATYPLLGQLPGGDALPAEVAGSQPVPTAIAVAGASTFIGFLGETWPEGAPSIVSLGADGTLTRVAGTLNFTVAMAIGPDGNLYVSQLAMPPADGSEMPGLGRVVRVYGDGTIEPVIENLPAPHGMTFDVAGNMYVPVYSAFFSTADAPLGQVARFDGIAAVG